MHRPTPRPSVMDLHSIVKAPDPARPSFLVWRDRTPADFAYLDHPPQSDLIQPKSIAMAARWNARFAGTVIAAKTIRVGYPDPTTHPRLDVAYALCYGRWPPEGTKAVVHPLPDGSEELRIEPAPRRVKKRRLK